MATPPGYVIAGASSGSGKTTLTLGLMAWLRRQGYAVAPFKVGPDFIDPGHHTRITGIPSRNLDGWMLSRTYNMDIFRRFSRQADIAVVEGVMGMYDGYDGKSEAGSTAQMAKWLDLPVVLVVNAKSMARSAAALVKGFVEFDPDVRFAGVVFNNLGSSRHLAFLREAAEQYLSVPVLGGIQRDGQIAIPERHLGLVTGDEHRLSDAAMARLADLIETGLDTDRLVKDIPSRPAHTGTPPEAPSTAAGVPVRIGVARDAAFCFYYPDNLDLLAANGAEPVFFSPITDRDLPEHIHGLYFGGGYPEVFAGRLSENRTMREAVLQASRAGMPIYGECGGFMYLCDRFISANDTALPMAGCLPMTTRMLGRLKSLGYREVKLRQDTILGRAGLTVRGHEFHYSEIAGPVPAGVDRMYTIAARTSGKETPEGYCMNNTLGTYVHLHFGSNPDVCRCFVNACRLYKEN